MTRDDTLRNWAGLPKSRSPQRHLHVFVYKLQSTSHVLHTMDTPSHHIHSDSEPLPTSTGVGTFDYSADNINSIDMYPAAHPNTTTTTHHNTHSPSHMPARASLGTDVVTRPPRGAECPPENHCGETRFDKRSCLSGDDAANRPPRGAEYPPENHCGETRFDEQPGLSSDNPHVKPGIGDKIIGKTEKVKLSPSILFLFVAQTFC